MRDSRLKRWLLKMWSSIYEFKQLYYVRRNYSVCIMTGQKTIDYIMQHNCSVARFGDGEFGIMLRKDCPIFQQGTDEMATAMTKVFENQSSNLLICLPRALTSTKGFEPFAKKFWEGWARSNQKEVVQTVRQLIGNDYCFGDAYISRPYTAYKSRKYAEKMFALLKTLWTNRNILIVEGEKTRLGIGNDLFDGARSIKRILGPAENAFDCYSKILNAVTARWNGELVILALGPTATILASDLSERGIQALDLGHIDIQYEWFLAGSKEFKPVPEKYTNEAIGGQQVQDCNKEDYIVQILEIID